MAVKPKPSNESVEYTKEQIVSAKKYFHRKDLLNVLLDDSKLYTLKDVDALIEKFMKGKVK